MIRRVRADEIEVGDEYEYRNAGTGRRGTATVTGVDRRKRVTTGGATVSEILVSLTGISDRSVAPHSMHTVHRSNT